MRGSMDVVVAERLQRSLVAMVGLKEEVDHALYGS
jgi:hypothetical protein